MDEDEVWVIKKLEKLKENINTDGNRKHDYNGRIRLLDELINYLERKCPECGSENIEEREEGFFFKRTYLICVDCGHTFG